MEDYTTAQMKKLGNLKGVGNTKATPGDKKRYRNWFFTLNNYTDEEFEVLKNIITQYTVINEEIGNDGTPHLQGCLFYKNGKTFTAIKKINKRIHWEIIRNKAKAIEYCKKSETRKEGTTPYINGSVQEEKKIRCIEKLYPWQQDIINLMEKEIEEPNDRRINWIYSEKGNIGKTALAKYICINYKNSIYISGRAKDMKYAIVESKQKPEIIICGYPRSIGDTYISYTGIEEVKDGIFFSTKYKSGMCIYNPPVMIVLANYPPIEEQISRDRWNIICLDEITDEE